MAAPRPAHPTTALAVAVVALGAGLSGCTSTSVLTLGVGDCLHAADLERGESVSDIVTVPCDEPHDAEIFASRDLPAGDYPGLDGVRAEAENFCLPEFESFVGIAYLESELDVYPLLPTSDSWEQEDDRTILCIAVAPEDVTGTLEGAER
jgi:hypothetical protein